MSLIVKNSGRCKCELPENCYGKAGWHFFMPTKDQCWKESLDVKFASKLPDHLASWLSEKLTTRETQSIQDESITHISCDCTRQTLKKEEDGLLTEMARPEPDCKYANWFTRIAYERCPAYWAKVRPKRKKKDSKARIVEAMRGKFKDSGEG